MVYPTGIHPAWGSDRNRIRLAPQIQAVLEVRYNTLFVLQVIPYIMIISDIFFDPINTQTNTEVAPDVSDLLKKTSDSCDPILFIGISQAL